MVSRTVRMHRSTVHSTARPVGDRAYILRVPPVGRVPHPADGRTVRTHRSTVQSTARPVGDRAYILRVPPVGRVPSPGGRSHRAQVPFTRTIPPDARSGDRAYIW